MTFPKLNRFATLLVFCLTTSIGGAGLVAQDFDVELLKDFQARNKQRQQQQMLMTQLIQLSWNKDLQVELEIVPDQLEEMVQTAREFQKLAREFQADNLPKLQEVQQLFQQGKMQEAVELSDQIYSKLDRNSKELLDQVDSALLPHQTQRMRQIAKQQSLRFATRFRDEFGIPISLADEMGLSDAEKRKLLETTLRVRKEYYEKIEALKSKANEEILAAIPQVKRAKLKDAVGDFYDHDKQQRKAAESQHRERQERREQMEQQQRERRDN